jgi:uncharacterized sulfatase
MTLHPSLLTLSLLTSFALAADATAAPPEHPNVLFIAVDDLNMTVGCFGDKTIQTPNIDRLAARGVKFDRAYCQYPLCNPSRVSMLTGVRPDTAKVYDLQTNFRDTMANVTPLPELFKRHGYFTARVGKIYHYGVPRQIGSGGMDDPNSWELAINPRGRDKDEEEKLHVLTRGTGKTLGFSMSWYDFDGTDDEQTDGQATLETIKLLERFAKSGQKFFMGMGFFRPHTPFVATKKWFDMYPKATIALPTVSPDDLADVPKVAPTIKPSDYGLSKSDLQDCVRGYRASVSCLDSQVGQLLDTLDRLKLTDNTVVVFVSDHGFLLGEHGQWQKQMLFEESNRVPLIFAGPGVEARGASPRTVELLDIYPTLVDLCGLPKPPQPLEGQSLLPLLNDPDAAWDRPAYSQVTRRVGKGKNARTIMGYSVRTERWRYTEWDGGKLGSELYDHDQDPHEETNLADDKAHAGVVAEMRELLGRITANREQK